MKRYKIFQAVIPAMIALITFSGCKKQLDEVQSESQISISQALVDPNATQAMYIGVYGNFRSYTSTFMYLGEMRSDIWTDGLFTESADGTAVQMYTHNINSQSVPFGNWAGFYNLIYQINNALYVIPKSPVSDVNKARWQAELFGMRAYVYYTLLKTWGKVPITTEPILAVKSTAETYKARSSRDSVMMQVTSDIEKSLQLFAGNNSFGGTKRVYWNRLATLTLKGDAYIWKATHLGGGTADLTTAKDALTEIKNLQGATLNLNSNYANIFDPTKKDNNPEIIFAINYEVSQAGNGIAGNILMNGVQSSSFSFSPTGSPTVQSVYPYVNAASRIGMNQAMITRLTTGNDQRIANSFKVYYSTTPPYAVRGVFLSKFAGSVSGTSQIYNNDFPIYRYADVLLLLAEAKAKLGQDPSAEINQIRQRAYGATAPVYVSAGTTADMNAILEEYLREFIGEGKRWWALRRAGDSYVYANIKPAYLSPTSGAKLELPISTGMISNDPLLKQTDGY